MANWQLTYNGLTIGDGTVYGLDQVTGFHDLPDVRTSDQPRARAHGMFAGTDLLGGRTITASVIITSTHPSDSTWQAFSQAFVAGQASELPLVGQIPGVANGQVVSVGARVRRLAMPIDLDYTMGVGRAVVELFATDPRIYSNAVTTLTTTSGTPTATGFTFPLTFPLTFGGGTTSGLISAENEGEFSAPWTARISGPITNPFLENITTGQTLTFLGSLNAAQTLVVSSLNRSIILNDTASRYSWLSSTSQWFDLVPGANLIRFSGTSGTGSLSFSFRSVWI